MRLVAPSTALLALALGSLAPAEAVAETPRREGHPHDDFIVREAMVPMRDGVRLFTLILVPKESAGGLPVLLERTRRNRGLCRCRHRPLYADRRVMRASAVGVAQWCLRALGLAE